MMGGERRAFPCLCFYKSTTARMRDFKCTPLFDVECLRNGTRLRHYATAELHIAVRRGSVPVRPFSETAVVFLPHLIQINVKKLQLTTSDTSKTAKITKR